MKTRYASSISSPIRTNSQEVWALAISSDERTIVSGAADSVLTFWEDCTEEQAEEQEAHRADLVLK